MNRGIVLIFMFIFALINGDEEDKIDDTHEYIKSNLNYLEEVNDIGNDAVSYIMMAAGDMYLINKTVPNISDKWRKNIHILTERCQKFLDRELEKEIKPEYRIFYEPKYWPLLGSIEDNKFVTGEIFTQGFRGDTLPFLTENDLDRSKIDDCLEKLIETNKISHTPRQCQLSCEKEMYNTKAQDEKPALTQRLEYIFAEIVYNCTNHDAEEIKEVVKVYCQVLMKDLLNLLEYDTWQKEDNRFCTLERMVICGSSGFSEFYEDRFVEYLLRRILPDGSMSDKDTQTTALNTAQTMAYLTSYLRMLLEKQYP